MNTFTKRFIFAIIIELLLTIVIGGRFLFQKIDSVEFDNSMYIYNTQDEIKQINSATVYLFKGVYLVNIDYSTESYDTTSDVEFENGAGTELLVEKNNLLQFKNHISYRVYVNQAGNVFVRNEAGIDNELSINAISIVYMPWMSAGFFAGKMLLVFAIIDLLIFMPKGGRVKKNHMIIFGMILLTSVPLTVPGVIHGHDVRFHMYRIAGLAEGLMNGDFPVRLQPNWLNGYGAATGVTYPDLLLYPFAILYLLGIPLFTTYKLYVIVMNLGTVLVTYYCSLKISKKELVAVVCSVLYSFSMWRLIDIYTRAALGEYTALLFLPLIALGVYEIYYTDNKISLAFIIGITGVVTSHPLTLLLVAEMIILYLLLQFRKTAVITNFVKLLLNGIITLLVNIGILLPIIDYYVNEGIGVGSGNSSIQGHGIYLSQLFTYDYLITGASVVGAVNQEMPLTLGLSLTIVIFIGITILFIRKEIKYKFELKTVLIIDIIALFLSTAYFPYELMMKKMPTLYKVLSAIQFPWRYLTVVTIVTVILMGILLMEFEGNKEYRRYLYVAIVGIALFQGLDYYSKLMNNQDRYYKYLSDATMDSFGDVNNFTLAGMDWSLLEDSSIVLSDSERVKVNVINREGTKYTLNIVNSSSNTQFIDLPVMGYSQYKASDADVKTTLGENKRLRLVVPAGYDNTISVGYKEPFWWRVTEILSIFTIVVLASYMIFSNKKSLEKTK